jgi:hypothetical protein
MDTKRMPPAPPSTVFNIKTWLQNRGQPIDDEEVKFLDEKDLVTIVPRRPPAQLWFEQNVLIPIFRWVRVDSGAPASRFDDVTCVDRQYYKLILTALLFGVAGLLLVAPMWILAKLEDMDKKLGVITSFLIAFLSVMSWAILASPFETLAATAGYVPSHYLHKSSSFFVLITFRYSAILVVFLQLGTTPTS